MPLYVISCSRHVNKLTFILAMLAESTNNPVRDRNVLVYTCGKKLPKKFLAYESIFWNFKIEKIYNNNNKELDS